MSSLGLNDDNDIFFTDYNLTFVTDINDQILQRVKVRLRFFEGEWFLNTAHGVPYFQSILGQKPLNLNLVSNILIEAILDVEGIASIEESIIDYEEVERKIKFEFIAKTISGTSINDTILI